MTEKQYSGATSHGFKEKAEGKMTQSLNVPSSKKKKESAEEQIETENIELTKLKQAGEFAKQVKDYARAIIKPKTPLLEIAEKIENKILELGGKPAFPVNLSINEIAAHFTPSYNEISTAHGLLKVDIGVHVDGFTADTAFSLDLEDNNENKKLIEAAESALKEAIEKISYNIPLKEIGKSIETAIVKFGFQPIINLSGHSIEQYELHSGITIPNHNNSQEFKLPEGTYAIEPFATSGTGKVIDGKPSGIYKLEKEGSVRDSFAREVLSYIKEEYKSLPFCSRWLVKKFGTRALIALKRIEEAGLLHQYPQLVEQNRKPVAQAEHTVVITKTEKIVTT